MIAVLARDAAGEEPKEARQRLLDAHLAHVEAVMDRILVAGPLTDADGTITGSLLILDAADEGQARELMARDPYSSGGIWENLEYRPFRGVAGRWVGGKAWGR